MSIRKHEESPVQRSVPYGRTRTLPAVYFGHQPFKCWLSSLFIWLWEYKPVLLCLVWSDIWHEIRQNVYKYTQNYNFWAFAGYELLMRLRKTSKIHSVFIFDIARSSSSLKHLILKRQNCGLFCSSFLFSQRWGSTWLQTLKGAYSGAKLLMASFSTAGTVGFILDKGFLQASLLSLP